MECKSAEKYSSFRARSRAIRLFQTLCGIDTENDPSFKLHVKLKNSLLHSLLTMMMTATTLIVFVMLIMPKTIIR